MFYRKLSDNDFQSSFTGFHKLSWLENLLAVHFEPKELMCSMLELRVAVEGLNGANDRHGICYYECQVLNSHGHFSE